MGPQKAECRWQVVSAEDRVECKAVVNKSSGERPPECPGQGHQQEHRCGGRGTRVGGGEE